MSGSRPATPKKENQVEEKQPAFGGNIALHPVEEAYRRLMTAIDAIKWYIAEENKKLDVTQSRGAELGKGVSSRIENAQRYYDLKKADNFSGYENEEGFKDMENLLQSAEGELAIMNTDPWDPSSEKAAAVRARAKKVWEDALKACHDYYDFADGDGYPYRTEYDRKKIESGQGESWVEFKKDNVILSLNDKYANFTEKQPTTYGHAESIICEMYNTAVDLRSKMKVLQERQSRSQAAQVVAPLATRVDTPPTSVSGFSGALFGGSSSVNALPLSGASSVSANPNPIQDNTTNNPVVKFGRG